MFEFNTQVPLGESEVLEALRQESHHLRDGDHVLGVELIDGGQNLRIGLSHSAGEGSGGRFSSVTIPVSKKVRAIFEHPVSQFFLALDTYAPNAAREGGLQF